MTRASTIPHGTTGGYANHRCRCAACIEAVRQYRRTRYWRVRTEPLPPWATHGSYVTYNNYSCRCSSCRQARREYDRSRRIS